MNQHTPAPWTIVVSPVYAGNYEIAQALTEHHEANARLIAAAPELLEACASWIIWMDSAGDGTGFPPNHEAEMLNAMRRAIAKAEGREPVSLQEEIDRS